MGVCGDGSVHGGVVGPSAANAAVGGVGCAGGERLAGRSRRAAGGSPIAAGSGLNGDGTLGHWAGACMY